MVNSEYWYRSLMEFLLSRWVPVVAKFEDYFLLLGSMVAQWWSIGLRSRRWGVWNLPTACCVLEQDTLLPECTSNTQEAVAPSRHDWKIDWDVKPQHKQTKNFLLMLLRWSLPWDWGHRSCRIYTSRWHYHCLSHLAPSTTWRSPASWNDKHHTQSMTNITHSLWQTSHTVYDKLHTQSMTNITHSQWQTSHKSMTNITQVYDKLHTVSSMTNITHSFLNDKHHTQFPQWQTSHTVSLMTNITVSPMTNITHSFLNDKHHTQFP